MPRVDVCQECYEDVLVSKLTRKIRPIGYTQGENYLLYSSYNPAFWACDSTDAGDVSMGLYIDRYRAWLNSDNTTTEKYGSQTWTGSGTYRSIVGTDASSLTNICFLAYAGAYHAQTTQAMTVNVGFCLSDGTGKVQEASWTFIGQRRFWFTKAIADLGGSLTSSELYFYVDVTISGASSKWWVDGACLSSTIEPMLYKPQTTGAARIYTSNGFNWVIQALCEKCGSDYILRPSQAVGEPRFKDWQEIRDAVEDL